MVDMKQVKEMLNGAEYDFLRNEPALKNIMFLTLGGSKAYGTDNENSDTDIRGCVAQSMSSLLGIKNSYKENNFEQYVETNTDTVVYSFNKLVELLLSCNPNTIELLGCKPEHYIKVSEAGKLLLEGKKLFLSQRAVASFGGYATAQLRRLTNALARDTYTQAEKERHIYNSCMNILNTFDDRHREMPEGSFVLSIDKTDREGMETEIFVDAHLTHYSLRELKGIMNELTNVIRDYEKIGKRNHKKDDAHLNKHAMHLIRLYLMGIDILEKEDIITYREADLPLLLSIRNGSYMNSDGRYNSAFFEMVDEMEKRLAYAAKNTSLPKIPDYAKVNELVMEINKKSIE